MSFEYEVTKSSTGIFYVSRDGILRERGSYDVVEKYLKGQAEKHKELTIKLLNVPDNEAMGLLKLMEK